MKVNKMDLVEKTPKSPDLEEIIHLFNATFKTVKESLNLSETFTVVDFKLYDRKKETPFEDAPISFGLNREVGDKSIRLTFYKDSLSLLPALLYREAYYCFVPSPLQHSMMIAFCINEMVISQLKEWANVDEFSRQFREWFVDDDLIRQNLTQIHEFFSLEAPERTPSQFFFEFIRKNPLLLDDSKVLEKMTNDYTLENFKLIRDADLAEAIWIIIQIFYKEKVFQNLHQYKQCFNKMKKQGLFQTQMTIAQFGEKLDWIAKYTSIGPSYRQVLSKFGVRAIPFSLSFNPSLDVRRIIEITKKIPMLNWNYSKRSHFSTLLKGFLIIPEVFFPEVRRFFTTLQENQIIQDSWHDSVILYDNYLNLNYFCSFHSGEGLVNPNHPQYDAKYVITFREWRGEKITQPELSLLDFSALMLSMNWASGGLAFKKSTDSARRVKTMAKQRIIPITSRVLGFQTIMSKINSLADKRKLVQFISKKASLGFFRLKSIMTKALKMVDLSLTFLEERDDIKSIALLQQELGQKHLSQTLEDAVFMKDQKARKLHSALLTLYFEDRNAFQEQMSMLKTLATYLDLLSALKIFSLESARTLVTDPEQAQQIIEEGLGLIKRLTNEGELKQIKQINGPKLERKFKAWTAGEDPILLPYLTSTINTTNFAKLYFLIELTPHPDLDSLLKQLSFYLPRILSARGKQTIIVGLYLPSLTLDEKKAFVGALHEMFGKHIINACSHFQNGFIPAFSYNDFYDYGQRRYVHSDQLFEETIKNAVQVLKEIPDHAITVKDGYCNQDEFWTTHSLTDVFEMVRDRVHYLRNELEVNKLERLFQATLHLPEILREREQFQVFQESDVYADMIDQIRYKVNYPEFGLSESYLYLLPHDYSKIDKKLLLLNSFKYVKYPAAIEKVNSLFVKYIFPLGKLNSRYINVQAQILNNVNEYCFFQVVSTKLLFHFKTSRYWRLDDAEFKARAQKILFEDSFTPPIPGQRSIRKTRDTQNNYKKHSAEFKDLLRLLSSNSKDLKHVFRYNKAPEIKALTRLLKKGLLLPYFKYKNLGFLHVFRILLPDLAPEQYSTIERVFHYFPVIIVNEIAGEYFYNQKVRTFESGLMIKLWLPDIHLSDFYSTWQYIFSYLDIKDFIILDDLVEGTEFLEATFENLEFLNEYNPLENLKWDTVDQQWHNVKVYGENRQVKYPKLLKKNRPQEED